MFVAHREVIRVVCALRSAAAAAAIEVIAAVNCLFINPCPPSQERGVAAAAAGKQGRLVCRWPQPAAVRTVRSAVGCMRTRRCVGGLA